jgi:hypothetical protein
MYIEGTGFYTGKECHKTESLQNHTATAYKEIERLGDRRNVGESSCNSGEGTGHMAQPLMFMIIIMMMMMKKDGQQRMCFHLTAIYTGLSKKMDGI